MIKFELDSRRLRQIRIILCAEVSIYMGAEKMPPRLNVNYCDACQVFWYSQSALDFPIFKNDI